MTSAEHFWVNFVRFIRRICADHALTAAIRPGTPTRLMALLLLLASAVRLNGEVASGTAVVANAFLLGIAVVKALHVVG
jgi:hypothetical protein